MLALSWNTTKWRVVTAWTPLAHVCQPSWTGLEQAGRMRSKETVLVTAAAGGTGQVAVELANLAGYKVVATCCSDDKAQLLTDLGCDRVINYNKEQPKVPHSIPAPPTCIRFAASCFE